MRTPVVVGNWKMNLLLEDARALANALARGLPTGVEAGVAPSAPYLCAIADVLRGSALGLAAQDCHASAGGAFTGEQSPTQLKSVQCRYVILGHSERREHFGERDEAVGEKARAVIDAGLTPIICIGERLEEREAEQTIAVVTRQLDAALSLLSSEEVAASIVAYEPVWAIGTGRTATPAQAQHVHAAIRARVSSNFGAATGAALRIQYGGSVKPGNAEALMSEADIDGALVGGASLQAESFLSILNSTAGAAR